MQNRKSMPVLKVAYLSCHGRSNADTRTTYNGATEIFFSGRLVHRKGFYSCSLAARDHVLLTSFQARVLDWMLPIEHVHTIIGQYGKSSDGEKPAFKDEQDVPNDSRCATFCAAVGHIENERWAGVPFLLKAGKGRWTDIWRNL